MIIFDVETGPLPEAEILPLMPEFKPDEVKVGNIKDPDKISAKIAEARDTQKREFIDRAALNPMTAQVLAIGVMDCATGDTIVSADSEAKIISGFWRSITREGGYIMPIIGFNVCLFDLPMLVKRSWRWNIPVPLSLRRGRYWSDAVLDLRDTWQMGDRQCHGSLDTISQFLGVGKKTGNGKDFAALLETDRAAALEYCAHDLRLTHALAKRMGIL